MPRSRVPYNLTAEPIVERERAGLRLLNLDSFVYGNWLFKVVSFGPPR